MVLNTEHRIPNTNQSQPKICLTIGGSDSGGAYGIQADLKTWTALDIHGMSALTVITAQNSVGVRGAEFVSAEFLSLQLQTVLDDYDAHAIKTGMLAKIELLEVAAAQLQGRPNVVIDPVLVNYRGESMFSPAVLDAYRHQLFPLAIIVTPNYHEAELLAEMKIDSLKSAETAARHIYTFGSQAVLIKRISHQNNVIDILYDGQTTHHLPTPYIQTKNTAGTGDTLSAAITAYLAQGFDLHQSVEKARAYTTRAIQRAKNWQLGAGRGPLAHLQAVISDQ